MDLCRLVVKNIDWEVAVKFEREPLSYEVEGESARQTDAERFVFNERVVVNAWNHIRARALVTRALERRYGPLLKYVEFCNTHEYEGKQPVSQSNYLPFPLARH
ncbi:hypothetical protein COU60_03780 [Candidatus Pacearchaeota archaeon CG10_big_fil_rev_8_21_14_0_10_34_76]|nr:MAG: hypothetical protein COU60_03780 [Candidatus Pacearchaeota archaeon CG10_big_fil_rev_8_21_14_0_10_34_76]